MAEVAGEAEIQMLKQCLHHLHSRLAEQNWRTNGRWKLNNLERVGARLEVSSQRLPLEKPLQLDLPPVHLRHRHRLYRGQFNRSPTPQMVSVN